MIWSQEEDGDLEHLQPPEQQPRPVCRTVVQQDDGVVAHPGHGVETAHQGIMATCVDLSGAHYPKEINGSSIGPMEGLSLRPAFLGQPLQRDALYWEHEGNRAIRRGDWKLVAKGAQGPWELYRIDQDRSELHNLADQESSRVRELSTDWMAWAEWARVLPLDPYHKRSRK